jgi:spermidine synthase
MGSAEAFLSYFVMGTDGMKRFGAEGVVNTDDNLHLEFSAPLSMDVPTQGSNARALYRYRESLLPYLLPEAEVSDREAQIERIKRNFRAGEMYARSHVLFLTGRYGTPEFTKVMGELNRSYPGYAPVRFLEGEVRDMAAMTPTLIRSEKFLLLDDAGNPVAVEISAVKVRIGPQRAAVIFVDNRTRTIFGQKYIDAENHALEGAMSQYAENVLGNLKVAYQREAALARESGKSFPAAGETIGILQGIIASMTSGV